MRTKLYMRLLAVSALASLLLASCGGGEKDNPSGGGGGTTTEVLSVSPTSLTLAPNASGTINITSNVAWTVSAPTGYTATPASGSNNGTVTIKAGSSATGGTLTVKGKSKSANVTLSSAGGAAAVSLSTDKVEIGFEAGKTATFNINCSGSWQIELPSVKPTWLQSVTPMSGTGNQTVTINTTRATDKLKDQTFITIKSGSNAAYLAIIKDAAPNSAPTKPVIVSPKGSNIGTITEFTWNASTDIDGDEIKYNVMISKDNTTWTSIANTKKTTALNRDEFSKNTTYYCKIVADDSFDGGKVESDVVSFTTGTSKNYWADGEVKQYNVNPDGSMTEVTLGSTPRPVQLIYTGDGYTQELHKYGGQFDKEIDAGVKALFEYEPYKSYTDYFTIYKVAAYSNETGMSVGDDWRNPSTSKDTKFKCTWKGGNSTGINCNTDLVIKYASACPGKKGATDLETGTLLTWSPISIIINADQYAGTNIWTSGISGVGSYGGMRMISIAQTPARHPSTSSYGGFAYTLRHEFGGHGFGLLGDEYVYYSTTSYPQSNESNFRYWQGAGAYCNSYLPEWDSTLSAWKGGEMSKTPEVEGENWESFANLPEYASANIQLFPGSATYGLGIYRSEQSSCMINNIPHFNTISRWKIYCRIKRTAGETPTIADFMTRDIDIKNLYSSAPATKSHDHRYCEGPLLMDERHSKPYRLR